MRDWMTSYRWYSQERNHTHPHKGNKSSAMEDRLKCRKCKGQEIRTVAFIVGCTCYFYYYVFELNRNITLCFQGSAF